MSESRLLLSLWREAGRHEDAAVSIPVIGALLSGALPLRVLTLYERSREAADFLLLAEWHAVHGVVSRQGALGWGAERIAALSRWADRRELAERAPGERWPAVLRELDTGAEPAHAFAGPMVTSDGFIGLVVFQTERALTPPERLALGESLEPIAAVVGNDYRLREMRRLSARAEAERDSLLARLGRASLNEAVVGADAGLSKVMARVDQVARTSASVLILGETGSGKEVIARAIHERSARHNGPFIRVNCGAVAPDLIDSELFGHEKGSFTGAVAARRGWFERASGGTLFLDEIGELAPAVQVRLLRVLQDGVVQRIGSETEQSVDVRVITATHRDLPQMVQEGLFREDLWYRIAVFPIILPPLREHLEDLPALARHFIRRAANRAGMHAPVLGADDLERLRAYHWPGNVRELGAVIERAVILGGGERLELAAAIGPVATRPRSAGAGVAAAVGGPGGDDADGLLPLDAAVTAHIRRALARCAGRVDGPHGAARLLGLNPNTLRSKMRKLRIPRTEPVSAE